MTGSVLVDGAALAGSGVGVSFGAPAALDLRDATLVGFALGLDLSTTRATLARVTGAALGDGLRATGSDVDASSLALAGAGTGVRVHSNATTLAGAALSGFATGALVTGGTLALSAGSTVALPASAGARGLVAAGGALTATSVDVDGAGLGTGFEIQGGTATLTGGAASGLERGVTVAGGSATVNGLHVEDATIGVRVASAGATFDGVTVDGADVGLSLQAPATFRNGALKHARIGAHFDRTTGGTLSGTRVEGAGTGVLLDRATGASVSSNAVTDSADPLRVASDATPASAHYAHTVAGNTVNGRELSYLYDSNAARTISSAVGHVVVAFSSNVRYTDLDLAKGQLHVVKSSDVVLGAKTAKTAALLAKTDPGALPAYERVWNGVRFKPYPGSMLGPDGVLDANYANDVDASWALVELWRDAGRAARFVDGRMAGPTSALLTWTGMEHAGWALAMDGFQGVRWFGSTYDSLPRTWTELEVASGVWVEVDPSYNQYAWSVPHNLTQMAGIDDDAIVIAAAQGATLDYALHGARNLNTDAVRAKFEQYQAAGVASIDASGNPLSGGDLARIATPRAVLPSEDVTRTPAARYADVPESRKWSVRIVSSEPGVNPDSEFNFEETFPKLYGRRISIGSTPDSEVEWNKVVAAGGIYKVDPRTVAYTPYLYVDGEIVDVIGAVKRMGVDGEPIWALPPTSERPVIHRPGDRIALKVDVRKPGNVVYQTHDTSFTVGGTFAVVVDIGGSPSALIDRRIASFQETLDRWFHGDSTTYVNHDDLVAESYYLQGLLYFNKLHAYNAMFGATFDTVEVPIGGVAMTGTGLATLRYSDGTQRVSTLPPFFDIRNIGYDYPVKGNTANLVDYRMMSGIIASALEDKVFTELYALRSVSTIKVLTEANRQGAGIYHLNWSETTALPHLNLPQPVMQSIVSAINRGWDVIVPDRQISYYNWTGVGWIEYDLRTGSAGWLIYGGATPITRGDAEFTLDEPVIMRGGSGAEYFPGRNGAYPDWGYSYWDKTGLDWAQSGMGAFADITSDSLKYSTLNNAATFGKRNFGDGKGLNNAHRSLLGKVDVSYAKYGKYYQGMGHVLAVTGQVSDMNKILQDDYPQDVQLARIAGVTAVNVATVAASGAVIAKTAAVGASIGAVGDGPGAVAGAVIGGVAGAIGLAVASDFLKGKLFGI